MEKFNVGEIVYDAYNEELLVYLRQDFYSTRFKSHWTLTFNPKTNEIVWVYLEKDLIKYAEMQRKSLRKNNKRNLSK